MRENPIVKLRMPFVIVGSTGGDQLMKINGCRAVRTVIVERSEN
jgi:hypothetical protein